MKKRAPNKTPLFANRRENVVVVHRGGGKKAQLDLRVRRLKTFAGPAAGTDRNERLIDRPGRRPACRCRDRGRR